MTKAPMRGWVICQGTRRVGFISGTSLEGLIYISKATGGEIYVKVTK